MLLRRDRQFLFDQLKSTHAVVEYLRRAAEEPIEIGKEPERYYRLATADHTKAPESLDQRLLTPHHISAPIPSLPLQPAASRDRSAHILIRDLGEDVAVAPITNNADVVPGESSRLLILGEVDRLPVAARSWAACTPRPNGRSAGWASRCAKRLTAPAFVNVPALNPLTPAPVRLSAQRWPALAWRTFVARRVTAKPEIDRSDSSPRVPRRAAVDAVAAG